MCDTMPDYGYQIDTMGVYTNPKAGFRAGVGDFVIVVRMPDGGLKAALAADAESMIRLLSFPDAVVVGYGHIVEHVHGDDVIAWREVGKAYEKPH